MRAGPGGFIRNAFPLSYLISDIWKPGRQCPLHVLESAFPGALASCVTGLAHRVAARNDGSLAHLGEQS